MTQKEYAIQHGLRFVGKPYIWGGQGATGLDCSGLMVEIGRTVGRWARKFDTTAQGLFDKTKHQRTDVTGASLPSPGDMVFFGVSSRAITHVGLCVEIIEGTGEALILEAVGGRRGVDTPEEAQTFEAMVTVRPMREDWVAFTRPFHD